MLCPIDFHPGTFPRGGLILWWRYVHASRRFIQNLGFEAEKYSRFLFIFGFELVVILDWGIVAICLRKAYLFLVINVSYY